MSNVLLAQEIGNVCKEGAQYQGKECDRRTIREAEDTTGGPEGLPDRGASVTRYEFGRNTIISRRLRISYQEGHQHAQENQIKGTEQVKGVFVEDRQDLQLLDVA